MSKLISWPAVLIIIGFFFFVGWDACLDSVWTPICFQKGDIFYLFFSTDATQMNNVMPTSPLLPQLAHPHSFPSMGQITNPYEQQPPGKELNKYASLKAVGKHSKNAIFSWLYFPEYQQLWVLKLQLLAKPSQVSWNISCEYRKVFWLGEPGAVCVMPMGPKKTGKI